MCGYISDNSNFMRLITFCNSVAPTYLAPSVRRNIIIDSALLPLQSITFKQSHRLMFNIASVNMPKIKPEVLIIKTQVQVSC